jgi:hypothetical protein
MAIQPTFMVSEDADLNTLIRAINATGADAVFRAHRCGG